MVSKASKKSSRSVDVLNRAQRNYDENQKRMMDNIDQLKAANWPLVSGRKPSKQARDARRANDPVVQQRAQTIEQRRAAEAAALKAEKLKAAQHKRDAEDLREARAAAELIHGEEV